MIATTTTSNTENMGRTAREMAEVQRDSYEAFTENLAATQRRSIGLVNGGLQFVRLQEDNVRAAQEWFVGGVRLLERQRRSTQFVQGWMGEAIEAVREQSEHNVRTAEAFARGISKHQEGLQAISQGWVGAYREFFSPLAYVQEGMKTFQRATQQGWRPPSRPSRSSVRARRPPARRSYAPRSLAPLRSLTTRGCLRLRFPGG